MYKLVLFLLGVCVSVVAAAAPQDPPREIAANGVEFMLVPGGWFWYRVTDIDPRTGNAGPGGSRQLKIWVDSYYLAKYEARASDFNRFMNSGTSRFASQYGPQTDRQWGDGDSDGCSVRKDKASGSYYLLEPQLDLPATHLSWDLATEFAQWMGFRLPTDAEWVRAFRGDDQRVFPWGNEYPDDTFAGFQEGGTLCNVQPVTAYTKGRSPYGIHNMAGNVFEYVQDWHNAVYLNQLRDGARNPLALEPHMFREDNKPNRLLRGGRWASGISELSIRGNRDTQPTDEPFRCFGARFALNLDSALDLLAKGAATVAP